MGGYELKLINRILTNFNLLFLSFARSYLGYRLGGFPPVAAAGSVLHQYGAYPLARRLPWQINMEVLFGDGDTT